MKKEPIAREQRSRDQAQAKHQLRIGLVGPDAPTARILRLHSVHKDDRDARRASGAGDTVSLIEGRPRAIHGLSVVFTGPRQQNARFEFVVTTGGGTTNSLELFDVNWLRQSPAKYLVGIQRSIERPARWHSLRDFASSAPSMSRVSRPPRLPSAAEGCWGAGLGPASSRRLVASGAGRRVLGAPPSSLPDAFQGRWRFRRLPAVEQPSPERLRVLGPHPRADDTSCICVLIHRGIRRCAWCPSASIDTRDRSWFGHTST